MPARFATDAREAVLRAAFDEANRRGDALGTEHLLLGVLAEPQGVAARALGVDLAQAREALRRLDGDALGSVGVDPGLAVAEVPAPRTRRPPFTNGAKLALQRAVREARNGRASAISVRELLLAILAARPPDPAALLLRSLGVDVEAIRTTL